MGVVGGNAGLRWTLAVIPKGDWQTRVEAYGGELRRYLGVESLDSCGLSTTVMSTMALAAVAFALASKATAFF